MIDVKTSLYGKPFIIDHPEFDFNISHSGDYVVLAFTYNRKIGVDIEKINRDFDISVKDYVFTAQESELITNHNAPYQKTWTPSLKTLLPQDLLTQPIVEPFYNT